MSAKKHESKIDFEHMSEAESQEILEKYDREAAFRTFTDWRGTIISAILICFSLFQLYSTWHVIPSTHMRPIHLAVVITMAYILYLPAMSGP